jgi:hypothetical protein
METEPELLAYHATQSGQIEKAVHYWHLASRMAIEASANAETIAHLIKGLGLLRHLPRWASASTARAAAAAYARSGFGRYQGPDGC